LSEVAEVKALSLWDSRGRPTVEVKVVLGDGSIGRAMAPAGASTGSAEALDLRDGGSRFRGYGVSRAVEGVNSIVGPALAGMNGYDQDALDSALIGLDGTLQRSYLGGNAMIATSMALAHAASASRRVPLWHYLLEDRSLVFPTPEVQIFGGGAHAEGHMDLQDFMVVPYGANSFTEAMEWVAEVYRAAGDYMTQLGRRQGVADEGGYWPAFDSNEQAIEALATAVENAGFSICDQIGLSLDIAANQIYREGRYHLKRESRGLSPDDWFKTIKGWLDSYPIIMIEDPFMEADLERHAALLASLPDGVQLVGDDLLVTQVPKMKQAFAAKACNTLLCKPNQVGTLTEARQAFIAATSMGWSSVMSARSGETEDTTIVDLALGWGVPQFKVGSFARSERMAKWNQMIRIESEASVSRYIGGRPWGRIQ